MKVQRGDELRAVLFDLGGVLVDYDHAATIAAVASISRAGIGEVRRTFERAGTDFGTGRLNGDGFYQLLSREVGLESGFQRFAEKLCISQTRVDAAIDYAVSLARKEGVQVGIISNINEIHAEWVYRHLPELAQCQPVIMSNEVGLVKPDPAIYQLALSRLGAAPSDAIFIDDSEANARGAEQIGMAGIVHHEWRDTRRQIERFLAGSSAV